LPETPLETRELNAQEIMQKVRERIAQRGPERTSRYTALEQSGTETRARPFAMSETVDVAIDRCKLWSSIQVTHEIATGKTRIIRPIILKIRRLLQREIRWTVDPIVHNQGQFNEQVCTTLETLNASLGSEFERINSRVERLTSEIDSIRAEIRRTNDAS